MAVDGTKTQAFVDRAFAFLKQDRCEEAAVDYDKVQQMGGQTEEVARLHATALSMIGVKQNEAGNSEEVRV